MLFNLASLELTG